MPWNQALSQHAQNTVVPDPGLGFAVTVANPGVAGEKDVEVTMTLDRQPEPIVLSRTVDRLDAGEAKTLLFHRRTWSGLTRLTTMIVEAQPVRGARALAAYPVVFDAARPPAAGAAAGLHGTGLEAVKALPGRLALSPRRVNTVVARSKPGFEVRVKDTGRSPETGVHVTLTILQSPSPIVATRTIPFIDTGREKTVGFRNLGAVVYGSRATVKVDIEAVPGEKNLANNSASYPVVFSLG